MLSTLLDKASLYSCLVIGDGIIDEYVYVRPQGKSPKENLISNRILRSERFQGGVWAAAEHVRGFCANVTIARSGNITVKRRYVEDEVVRKLFEVHEEQIVLGSLFPSVEDFDVVIVTDFGHGGVDCVMQELVTSKAKFLAVNAQTNSSNLGFNLITKYSRADYVVIDELEARLAAHDRYSPLEDVIRKLGFPKIVITLGSHGAIGFDGQFYRSPSVSGKVVDTMGAGDAFFCVSAPLAAAGADMPTLCRVGNAAGAIKCSVVGHRKSVTREALLAYLQEPTVEASER